MTTDVEIQMHHLTQHYNPNEIHPAESALKYVLDNVKTAIKSASNVPSFFEDGLLSIPLTKEQLNAMDAQVRTLRMVEKMIMEQYPGVLKEG